MWFSYELFLCGLWCFCIFCVAWSYTLQSCLWHHWKTQQSPVPGHLLHLLFACTASGTPGPQHSSGVPGVTIVQIFHFLQHLCNDSSFQQNLEALQPLLPSSARTFSKLALLLMLSLCFLSGVGNKDVTQIQEGWWKMGLPPGFSQLMKERKMLYKASGLTLQKTLYKP